MNSKNKRGVSIIIGYVLLIVVVMAVSVLVYQWLRTYVPKSSLSCPEGVSVQVPNWTYDCTNNILNFTLYNTGTFSIAGYFIHASTSSSELATIDLYPHYYNISKTSDGAIVFYDQCSQPIPELPNCVPPETGIGSTQNSFNLSKSPPITSNLAQIEITPVRYVVYNSHATLATCSNAKVTVPIHC